MKDYKSLTCLEIKEILKKHNVTGYSKLCKQELVNLVKKTLNKKKIKKGGLKNGENFLTQMKQENNITSQFTKNELKNKIEKRITSSNAKRILLEMIELPINSNEYKNLDVSLRTYKDTNKLIAEYLEIYSRITTLP